VLRPLVALFSPSVLYGHAEPGQALDPGGVRGSLSERRSPAGTLGHVVKGLAGFGMTMIAAAHVAVGSAAQEPAVRPLTVGDFSNRAPAWSPDGTRIAFESERNELWSIHVLNVASGAVERLTSSDSHERYPAWSPNGEQLVFVCTRGSETELCVWEVASREVVRVIASPGNELWPAWSPDGRDIAFTRQIGDSLDIQIVRLSDVGSDPAVTTVEGGRWPRWSPDGRRLAFFSRRDTNGLDDEIYLFDRPSGGVARLTTRIGHDFCPSWSPSGDRLVVVSVEPDGTRSLRILDEQGREVARLARGYHRVTEPSWSPDGRSIVYTGARREGQPHQLYLERIEPGAR
jgi:TolB protein